MKQTLVTAFLSVSLLLPVFAEEDAARPKKERATADRSEKNRENPRERMKDRFAGKLTPEERERFQAARKQALEDPEIKELREKAESSNREFFQAMKAKMNEIDPGLTELLRSKMGPGDGARGKDRKGFGSRKRPGALEGLSALSEGERQRLMAAREVAKGMPSVQAAQENRAAASTKEERKAADESFAKAMREAVLQADPGLAPILEKISPKKKKGQDVQES